MSQEANDFQVNKVKLKKKNKKKRERKKVETWTKAQLKNYYLTGDTYKGLPEPNTVRCETYLIPDIPPAILSDSDSSAPSDPDSSDTSSSSDPHYLEEEQRLEDYFTEDEEPEPEPEPMLTDDEIVPENNNNADLSLIHI